MRLVKGIQWTNISSIAANLPIPTQNLKKNLISVKAVTEMSALEKIPNIVNSLNYSQTGRIHLDSTHP